MRTINYLTLFIFVALIAVSQPLWAQETALGHGTVESPQQPQSQEAETQEAEIQEAKCSGEGCEESYDCDEGDEECEAYYTRV